MTTKQKLTLFLILLRLQQSQKRREELNRRVREFYGHQKPYTIEEMRAAKDYHPKN